VARSGGALSNNSVTRDLSSATAADSLVYVSLPPGSIADGESATIQNLATGQLLTVQMADGGFDPVPLVATVGDTLELEVYGHNTVLAVEYTMVIVRRPPTLVRTDPPKGKTDVPLNTEIVIVFSEPMDPTSVAAGVHLSGGGAGVAGSVTLSDSGIVAHFAPNALLAPQSNYELLIDTSVRNLRGDALDSAVHVSFTTAGDRSSSTVPEVQLSVSGNMSVSQGSVSSPFSITASAQTGFSGAVSVAITGLPDGVTTIPASPFTIEAGASQAVTFAVPAVTPAGKATLTLSGTTRGTLSRSTSVSLTVTKTKPVIRTYQQGTVLYIETDVGNESSRIGIDTDLGGSIVEASWNGTNFLNHDGTGTGIQAALYDGNVHYDSCGGCSGSYGWRPTQSGDRYDHGSPVLSQLITPTSIYTKTQPYQWDPDDKGGSPSQPVLGDAFIEQTVAAVPDHPRAFQIHYKVTHFGSDNHADYGQEFPTLLASPEFDRFVYYGGTSPWTNGPLTTTSFPPLGPSTHTLFEPEKWGALVNEQGNGVSVYAPANYPYSGGWTTSANSHAYHQFTFFSFGSGAVVDVTFYVIVGDYRGARAAIYDLKNTASSADIFPPYGFVDSPAPNTQVSGTINVTGWLFDNVAVAKVEVYVDGVFVGNAEYGTPRPDVATAWPNALTNCGYQFALYTNAQANGLHTIQVRATDTSGNTAVLPDVVVLVHN
jgi:hypothetical protein